MNKLAWLIATIVLLINANTVFATDLTACEQLAKTGWKDDHEKPYNHLDLTFHEISTDSSGKGIILHYTLGAALYEGYTITDGSANLATQCTTLSDGSVYITLPFDDGITYIILQTSGEKTMKVLPGSIINRLNENWTQPLTGSFTKISI